MSTYKLAKSTTPKWMTSFTYLLILMLSFFILLLSCAQLDVIKYKKVVLSLQYILGITNRYGKEVVPLNASMVLQKYSNENTTAVVVKEILANSTSNFQDLTQQSSMGHAVDNAGLSIAQELTNEIKSGIVDMQTNIDSIVIRLNEKYSFDSGSIAIKNDAYPVLYKISSIIAKTPGLITVAGFTDDIPMQNGNLHDNWELSALRAYKVLSVLLENGNRSERFTLLANAANNPLYANTSINNRAKNRRVEITLIQPGEKVIPYKRNIKMINDKNSASETPIFNNSDDNLTH